MAGDAAVGFFRRLIAGLLCQLALAGAAAAAPPCVAHAGSDALLIRAVLLTPAGPPAPGEVLVEAGRIACVGAHCLSRRPDATRLDCPQAVLSPGFINDHEHLGFGHIAPRPDDGVRYGHRHDWRKGLRGFAAREDFQIDLAPDLLAWSELRHVLTGTTSLIGGFMAPGLARNLDLAQGLEGLAVPPARYAVFPLDDAAGILREGDCDYGPKAATEADVRPLYAYVAHVAEGVDAAARNEFACVDDAGFDTTPAPGGGGVSHALVAGNVAIVHGVALTPPMLAEVARRGASIVWSPRSNLSLYGRTLDVAAAEALGINLALGTDWLPSGSISMPREAACALDYSRDQLGGRIGAAEVWRMMTLNAARAVHEDDAIGSLQVGLAADLVLVRGHGGDPYETVVRASAPDVLLVLRGGKALAGEAVVMRAATKGRAGCEPVTMAGEAHTVCIADDAARSYRALAAEMAGKGVWPAFFKGAPPVEPTCRAG